MRRLALSFLLAAVLAGCGGGEAVRFAEPQLLRPAVAELDGSDGVGFQLEVRVLRLERSSWSVEASVVNRTGIAWRIGRPHVAARADTRRRVSSSQRAGRRMYEHARAGYG